MPLLIILIILAVGAIIVYNSFIRKRYLIKEAWSGIDIQLKRRYDLIPNLIRTVQGYAKHERQLFEEVTQARSKAIEGQGVQQQRQAENTLTGTLRNLFAVAENYPELKANQNFLDLQQNLSAIENDIQLARRYYNGTVRDFNILVESFPSSLVARAFNFEPAEFFEIDLAIARETPEVKF